MNLLNCLGVCDVAMDKNTDTDEIHVTLPNSFPSQDGEVVTDIKESDTTFETTTGNSKTGKVLESNGVVSAKWFNLNSNRLTPPDVRKGSKVIVYQWLNDNTYLWTTYGLDKASRLETVVFVFSASPNIDSNTPITPDNYYMFTISSHRKKIEILTGQGNGEALGMQFTINMGEGWWGNVDSDGNTFMVNGVERSLTYMNKDKSVLTVNKKDFSLINKGNTLIKTDESVKIDTKAFELIASESVKVQTKDTTWNSSNSFNMKTDNLTMDLGVWYANVKNKFTLFGDQQINGKLNSTGKMESDTDVVFGGISGKGHKHGGVKSGGDVSGTPV